MVSFEYFLSQIPHLDVVREHAKRSNKLLGIEVKDIFNLPYWTVKNTIPNLIEEGKYDEVFQIVLKAPLAKIKKADNHNKFKFYLWLMDQYKIIIDLEKTQLHSTIDPKLINAGIKKMEVLNDFPLIDAIAKDYCYTHEEAKNLPYETIFEIQLKNKIENDIQKKLNEINKVKQ